MEVTVEQERLDRALNALDRIGSELADAEAGITSLNICIADLNNNPCIRLVNTMSVINQQIDQKRKQIKKLKRNRESIQKMESILRKRVHGLSDAPSSE